MQPTPSPSPFPAPGGRTGGATIPTGIFSGARQCLGSPPFPSHFHSHSRRMEDGVTNHPHRLLLGALSSPFPAAPSPPGRVGGGIRCSPSFVLRPLGMIPRDGHFAPPVSPSAFLPDFLLSASPCGRIRPFPSPSTPNPAGKRPAEPRHCGFTPGGCTSRPVPQRRPAVPPWAWGGQPLKPPRERECRGDIPGSRSHSCSPYLPAPCAAPGEGVAQVKALPFSYLAFPVRLE